MSKKINIGVLGAASIAERYIVPSIIDNNEKYRLIGVASRNSKRLEEFSGKYQCSGYGNYRDLLQIEGIDAVYIPLPNQLHKEWILEALEKGVHVLSEKPLVCSYSDAQEINESAKEKGLVVFENFQFRFHKQLEKIQEIIKQGVIGEIRSIRSSFGFPPFPDKNNIRYKRELGGGALFDAGVYPLKISRMLMGDDIEVQAARLFHDAELDVDLWGGAFLAQKNGPLFSEIAFGFDNFYQCNLEVWGSEGKLVANRIFTAPPNLDVTLEVATKDSVYTVEVGKDNHFSNMLDYFYALVNGGASVEDEYLENLSQARLVEELYGKANG